jgi:hypothetical protein
MVTGAVPVDVNVTGRVVAVFTVTSPNVKLAALIDNWGLDAAVPVPLRLTTAVLLVDESLWIVSWPAAAPGVVGSNSTSTVTDCFGFKVTGKVAPDIVKPVPASVAELMVTGAVPVDVNVTGCVDAVFTVTLPNVKLAALIVNCGLGTAVPVPLRLTIAVLLVDESLWIVSWPAAAPGAAGSNCTSSVTDWLGFKVAGNETPEIVNPAPVRVPDLIVTGAVPVDVNVRGCVDAVSTVTLPNVKLAALIVNCGLGTAVPVPLRLTTAVLFVDESLWILSWPASAPVLVGSKCTFTVTDWLGFKVTGKAAPDIVKAAPVSAAELMVTGAVPVDVNVTGCVDTVFNVTLPNVKLDALTVNCGLGVPVLVPVPVPLRLTTAVLSVDESLWTVSWPAAAPVAAGSNCTFSVADWAGFKVIGNLAPDIVKPLPFSVPELMVTGAVPVDVIVRGSVFAVFTVTLPNVKLDVLSVNWGLDTAVPVDVPVPLRLTTAVLLAVELLWIVSWPAAAPVTVGSKRTFTVTDWLGLKVTGNVAPDVVKPVPVSAAELMVTGAVPVDVNVTGCVDAVFTITLPNVTLAALTVSSGFELLPRTPDPLNEPWATCVPEPFIAVNWPE